MFKLISLIGSDIFISAELAQMFENCLSNLAVLFNEEQYAIPTQFHRQCRLAKLIKTRWRTSITLYDLLILIPFQEILLRTALFLLNPQNYFNINRITVYDAYYKSTPRAFTVTGLQTQ